jgi:signal transduction histidine kinase
MNDSMEPHNRHLPPPGGPGALVHFCRQLHSFATREELLRAVAGKINNIVGSRGGAVLLLDGERRRLFVAALSTDDPQLESFIRSMRLAYDPGKWRQTELCNSASIIDVLKAELRSSALNQKLCALLDKSLIAPLSAHVECFGLIWAIDSPIGTPEDEERLQALAGVTAAAMEASLLRQKLDLSHERVKDFDSAKDQVIHHLSHAMKTPVSVLIASLKLLAKHLNRLPDQTWSDIYERTHRNLERLLDIEYEMEDILGQSGKASDAVEELPHATDADDFFHNVNIEFLVHELKDPVGIVETGIRMLMEKPAAAVQERILQRMLRNARRTRDMLNELLEVGRTHNACFHCRSFEPLAALQRVVVEVVEINDPQLYDEIKDVPSDPERLALLAGKGIRVEIAPGAEGLVVEQDEVKFRQVAGNLIKNSFFYRRRHLLIHLACRQDHFSISIRDDGPGIAAIHHEAIFQRYKQVTPCPGMARNGHGLGLAVARILTRAMGGDITVDSELGQGALFHLRLPVTYRKLL